ncbi:cAMP-binding protein [Adhaeribacter aerolatus]|uniref:cAMP-binding protein n=1 Tax=Adhaeribacter aerolatus TaxID=670289 RepID=A0A512B2E3_9BACT|nr:Crp/Fnr family transcriptional regulator [Adhaeribacter aerolatus]GEO06132.1 cAMP-binding protein [Adhaeribacter aerolatus]
MSTLTPEALKLYRQHLEAFVSFTDPEWALFSAQLYRRDIRKREVLVEHGKVCHEVCFILSGSFRFFFIKDGVEISNYFCFSGELISAYQSFLKQAPSFPTIQAMEDASLICFTYQSLQALLQNPTVALKMERFGRLVAEYLICCYEERVVSFVTQTPEERYLDLLQKQPDLLQRVPQHYVANYLGITPVSLSRIRKRLAAAAAPKHLTLVA